MVGSTLNREQRVVVLTLWLACCLRYLYLDRTFTTFPMAGSALSYLPFFSSVHFSRRTSLCCRKTGTKAEHNHCKFSNVVFNTSCIHVYFIAWRSIHWKSSRPLIKVIHIMLFTVRILSEDILISLNLSSIQFFLGPFQNSTILKTEWGQRTVSICMKS